MILKKSLKIVSAILVGCMLFGATTTAPVFASEQCDNDLPYEVRKANGCPEFVDSQDDVFQEVLAGILNGVIGASSLVAVIFIIIGGINYTTSEGDTSKLQKAKSTILYAVIGLLVCTLAFAIVNWAIGAINGEPADDETSQTEG